MSSDWPKVRLEDVTSILGDGLHGTPMYDEHGEYYFINGNNLSNGKIVIDEKTKRTSREVYLTHKKNLNDRTILVSINGTIGNVGLYHGENVFLGKSACYFNVIKEVDKQFIRYVVTNSHFQNYINSLATGSTIKNVSLKLMRDYEFRLPPLGIQKKISKTLEDLDNKIQLNRQINQTLEQIAQAIFKSWFVDFEPVKAKIAAKQNGQDPERAAMCAISGKTDVELDRLSPEQLQHLATTAALFPDEFEDSDLEEIPKGWSPGKVGDMVEFGPKRTLKKGTVAPYLDMKNMPIKGHLAIDVYPREFGSGTKFSNGDTLLARITPCLENGKTAFVDFLEDGEVGWGSTEYIVMRAKDGYPECLTYFIARHEPFRQFAIQSMMGTSGRQRASAQALSEMPWGIPDNGVARRFGCVSSTLLTKAKLSGKENKALASLRDSLLPKLLSGEILVNEVRQKIVEAA